MMGAEARTGNSHKEMKIQGGITGRREACSDSQAIRKVGMLGVSVYYSHGPAPSQLLRCMCPTRTIHTHSRPPFSHFPPWISLQMANRSHHCPTGRSPAFGFDSHLEEEEDNLAINSVLCVIFRYNASFLILCLGPLGTFSDSNVSESPD